MNDDLFFEQLGEVCDQLGERAPAPSTLKSRVFTALVRRQQQQGPLKTLSACRKAGETLCIFEQLVAIAPVGEPVKAKNPCEVCHARLLGEKVDDAPIWWAGCPYVQFQNR